MLRADRHRDSLEKRHADLLRRARSGELVHQVAAGRADERRARLARSLRRILAPT